MSILVSRIIGNHIPGRYIREDAVNSVARAIQHMPYTAGQFWIFNRIWDQQTWDDYDPIIEEWEIFSEVIPFVESEYRAARNKSHYLTNVNHARNDSVHWAGEHSHKFALPLDSRCIFTEQDWDKISAAVNKAIQQKIPYVVVPQVRLQSGEEWDADFSVGRWAFTEPAIALSVDAPLLFDEDRRFGDADKAELLAAIGYPGPWNHWAEDARRVDPGLYGKCFLESDGLIRVLPSGNDAADRDINERARVRAEGLQRMVEQCNLSVFGPK